MELTGTEYHVLASGSAPSSEDLCQIVDFQRVENDCTDVHLTYLSLI